ncbi:MAG: DKNYY domain-containing protein, partial [Bacteroidales bacterium]|nr:DKNYY domain-containing protein [Bacteroidales bacterium]
YYKGKKIPDATAFSFKVLEKGYAKDSFNSYYRGKKIN